MAKSHTHTRRKPSDTVFIQFNRHAAIKASKKKEKLTIGQQLAKMLRPLVPSKED